MPGRALPAARRPAAVVPPRRGRAGTALALLVLLLAGCGTAAPQVDDGSPVRAVGAAATSTRAAELRAALTWLGTERVHLVLVHAQQLAAADGERAAPGVVAARRAVDESAVALADALGGEYSGARSELLPALRAHDAALLSATARRVAGAGPADEELDDARAALASSVRRVVPRLRAQDVDAALAGETTAVVDAAQALVDDGARAPALQRAAHEAAWSTARLLAVGVSTDRGLGLAGSPATELRARLTGLLVEHALLSGDLAGRLRAAGGDVDDPAVRAVETALAAAAVSLAELVGRSLPEKALPVLDAWRAHLADVRAHALARVAGGPLPAPGPDAVSRLQQALAPHADILPPRAGELGARSEASLRAAVDAAATGSPTAPLALRAAAADRVAPAALLAAALAERLALS